MKHEYRLYEENEEAQKELDAFVEEVGRKWSELNKKWSDLGIEDTASRDAIIDAILESVE